MMSTGGRPSSPTRPKVAASPRVGFSTVFPTRAARGPRAAFGLTAAANAPPHSNFDIRQLLLNFPDVLAGIMPVGGLLFVTSQHVRGVRCEPHHPVIFALGFLEFLRCLGGHEFVEGVWKHTEAFF